MGQRRKSTGRLGYRGQSHEYHSRRDVGSQRPSRAREFGRGAFPGFRYAASGAIFDASLQDERLNLTGWDERLDLTRWDEKWDLADWDERLDLTGCDEGLDLTHWDERWDLTEWDEG
jgi:hypothetical protein